MSLLSPMAAVALAAAALGSTVANPAVAAAAADSAAAGPTCTASVEGPTDVVVDRPQVVVSLPLVTDCTDLRLNGSISVSWTKVTKVAAGHVVSWTDRRLTAKEAFLATEPRGAWLFRPDRATSHAGADGLTRILITKKSVLHFYSGTRSTISATRTGPTLAFSGTLAFFGADWTPSPGVAVTLQRQLPGGTWADVASATTTATGTMTATVTFHGVHRYRWAVPNARYGSPGDQPQTRI